MTYTTDDPNTAPTPFTRTTVTVPSQPTVIRRRPIGIRRLPSNPNTRLSAASGDDGGPSRSGSGRKRAISAPQDPHLNVGGGSTRLTRQSTRQSALPPLQEESSQHLRVPGQAQYEGAAPPPTDGRSTGIGRRRSISNAARSFVSRFSNDDGSVQQANDYEDEVVDLLDTIGPNSPALSHGIQLLTFARS